jgi:hypothetical protein
LKTPCVEDEAGVGERRVLAHGKRFYAAGLRLDSGKKSIFAGRDAGPCAISGCYYFCSYLRILRMGYSPVLPENLEEHSAGQGGAGHGGIFKPHRTRFCQEPVMPTTAKALSEQAVQLPPVERMAAWRRGEIRVATQSELLAKYHVPGA